MRTLSINTLIAAILSTLLPNLHAEIILWEPIVMPLGFSAIPTDGLGDLQTLRTDVGGLIYFNRENGQTERSYDVESTAYNILIHEAHVIGEPLQGSASARLSYSKFPSLDHSLLSVDTGASTLLDLQISVNNLNLVQVGEVSIPFTHDDNSVRLMVNDTTVYEYWSQNQSTGTRSVDLRIPVQSLTDLHMRYQSLGSSIESGGLDLDIQAIRFYPGKTSVPEPNPFGDIWNGLGNLLDGAIGW